MYTHWQAAWRGACALGFALLAVTVVPLLSAAWSGDALPAVTLLMPVLCGAVFIVVTAAAFRVGFHFSGIRGIALAAVVSTPLAYLVLLLIGSTIPLATSVMTIGLPTPPGETQHALLMLNMPPISAIIVGFIGLPTAVAYIVGRISRGRASVA